jgi:uncharacterized protein YkuJ
MFRTADVITYKDIDSDLREIMAAKNDSLVEAMTNGKKGIFQALGSKKFLEDLKANAGYASQHFRKYEYYENEYRIFDEYHCSHLMTNKDIVITSEDGAYTFNFTNEAQETYVSLVKLKRYDYDYLIALIYGKQDGKWKISEIKVTQIGRYGKTAQDLYELAKEKEKEGYLFDACNYIDMADQYIEYTDGFIKFKDAENINAYKTALHTKSRKKYTFPMVLENISTKPAIESISVVQERGKLLTKVTYLTYIPFYDSEAREIELKEVKKEAQKEFKDIDLNSDEVIYYAYSAPEIEEDIIIYNSNDYYEQSDRND